MVVVGPDQHVISFDLSETRREVAVVVGRMRHPALVATFLGLRNTATKKTNYQSVTNEDSNIKECAC